MTFSELEHPLRWLFLSHALAGGLALALLLAPLLSKKGGKLHTKTGWVYIAAMVFVGLSSFVITPFSSEVYSMPVSVSRQEVEHTRRWLLSA